MDWIRDHRWPWQPREYVAVIAALSHAEQALARREQEARAQRVAQAEIAVKQDEVRQELMSRRRKRQ